MIKILFFLLTFISILYAAFARNRQESQNLKTLQKRHQSQHPEIKYDYNRFNTKKERNTSVRIERSILYLKTDIQNFQIANETLVSKISSNYEGIPFIFDFVVQPFGKVLFEIEGYKNFNQKGVLILGAYEKFTKAIFEKIEALNFLFELMPETPKATYLDLNAYKVDKAENKIILFGNFPDAQEFKVSIDYKNYLLEMEISMKSLRDVENFRDFKDIKTY